MRLGGWQRIGIVLSGIFMIGAAIYRRKNQEEIESINWQVAWDLKNICSNRVRELQSLDRVPSGFASYAEAEAMCQKNYDDRMKDIFGINEVEFVDIAFAAIAPVISAWVLVYLLLFMFRWVKKGFQP
jgi:hypothetical protein